MTEILNMNGKLFHEVMVSAANCIENNKEQINDLNVFPVPDGDTGTNMSLTIGSVRNFTVTNEPISEVAKKAANSVLRSARGNSGSILSLFFRGFAKAVNGLDVATADDIAAAFAVGKEESYKAVMAPTEGTILTVIRRCAEEAVNYKVTYKNDLCGFFKAILETAETTLDETPDMLPILKEAHVVDAGGCGFVMILKGLYAALCGEPVASETVETAHPVQNVHEHITTESKAEFSDFHTEDIKFSYCTECIVDKSQQYMGENTAHALYEKIIELGDSAVFIDAEDIIKLHIHTNHPGIVLELATLYGMLATVKIENMKNQHSSLIGAKPEEKEEKKEAVAAPTKPYGFVAVCMGDGLRDMFQDCNVDNIVYGGQTMNPSMQDILDAVNKTPAETVYVLPNNKNIDMVANQAAETCEDKNVIVIHTKSVPEGVSALLNFDDNATVEDNTLAMEEAIKNVKSLSVTRAVRDASIGGIAVRSGQTMGLVGGKMRVVGNNTKEAIEKLLPIMEDASYITVFYGEDVNEFEAGETLKMIEKAAKDAEVVLARGGQPLYDYIISVE